MQIKDSVFIITGGASGLGAGTARLLVARVPRWCWPTSMRPQATRWPPNWAPMPALSLPTSPTRPVRVPVSMPPWRLSAACMDWSIAPALRRPKRCLGRNGPHSLEVFSRTVNVNLIGSFNMIRLASEAMSKGEANAAGERGVIVSTASVAAYDGQIGQAAYAASKGGVVGMTLPIARELARFGIRVMTIAPGIFETPMLLGMPQEVQDAWARWFPSPLAWASRPSMLRW
jgi:NAD(P)-dependent dehydrogenase (short-subunit alcohol dehydrogenase family)